MVAKLAEEEHPIEAFGWAARDQSGVLSPFKFSRRATGEKDVQVKVLYCGMCHSDLHTVRNDWGFSQYPVVPGTKIKRQEYDEGVVDAINTLRRSIKFNIVMDKLKNGNASTKVHCYYFLIWCRHEIVGVVTEVGSKVEKYKVGDRVGVGCMVGSCRSCDSCHNNLENYCPSMILTYGAKYYDGTTTYGGYSDIMVGWAMSPSNLRRPWGSRRPLSVSGPTLFWSAPIKMNSSSCSLATDRSVEKSWKTSHAWCPRKATGATCVSSPLRKIIGGSIIGGIKETQEMLEFAAKHNVKADIEVIPVDYINTAMERMLKSDVRYRFVIDIGNTMKETGEKDVAFKVLYCGICHSDLHMLKNEWGNSTYPLVPGHEIVGEVTGVGSKVTKFKVGDRVGVGCMVQSCRSCDSCSNHLENYCPKMILTYAVKYTDGTITYGGYSDTMVADEHFVVRIPDNLPLDACAPLLCAGITVYSPLKFYGLDKPGMNIGVVGLGGLGHVAVKFAKAMGLKVTVISTSPNKKQEALERLGADSCTRKAA
ncbi:hypothetical protein Tsubulata_030893, partial [Turnera subulata]